MQTEIIDTELKLNIIGFQGIAQNKDYAGMAFKLMDKMWKIVKGDGIKHKGMNIWVYEDSHAVFAGVEPEDPALPHNGLEKKTITLKKYAYYKHIGPYQLIGKAGEQMRNEIKSLGLKVMLPYIEIYGHWVQDESKLETELLMEVE